MALPNKFIPYCLPTRITSSPITSTHTAQATTGIESTSEEKWRNFIMLFLLYIDTICILASKTYKKTY